VGIADPETTAKLGDAHDAAVEAALGYMEREACRAPRGVLSAAGFGHRRAALVGDGRGLTLER